MKKLLILSLIIVTVSSFTFVTKLKGTTGTLIVKIEMPEGKEKADADVDLAMSYDELIDMNFVASKITDKAGVATFTLPEGTYYIGVTQAIVTDVFTNRETSATVTAGKKTKVTILLKRDN